MADASAADPSAGPSTIDPAMLADLLKQAGVSPDANGPSGGAGFPAGSASADDPAASSAFPDQTSIEELLRQATFEDPGSGGGPGSGMGGGGQSVPIDADAYRLPNFNEVLRDAQVSSIDLLRDVELNVKIELGRARMMVEDVLRLTEGSVVELDKLAGDPVDVFVNDRLVARGEVLVLNDNFCVRVNEIVTASKEEGL
jgi:flagellar motor switch protein FliN/FliY